MRGVRRDGQGKKKQPAPPPAGRLGAERWLAVRQKSSAGPIEPDERKKTRGVLERETIERELDG